MNRQEIRRLLSTPFTGARRRDYYGSVFGQMFGWIAGADQEFLCDWLPGEAPDRHDPMRIVEVGTFLGSTARGLIVLSGGGQIACIDSMLDVHEGSRGPYPTARAAWEATLANSVDLSAYAALIEGESREVGARWSTPIDLAFIDADHAYEPALMDLRQFGRHVVVGGCCLVDDMDMPDVERACADYFDATWQVVRRPTGGGKILAMRRVA